MRLDQEIHAFNGTLIRQEDSRYAVNLWYIPGGYDYTNATVVVGFWPEELKADAEAFYQKYDRPGEMAHLIDLVQDDPEAKLYQPASCKHCKKKVNFDSHQRRWVSDKSDLEGYYCWMDPVEGSQIHEV